MRLSDAIDALGEPYPGLRPFRRDETHIFFGRETTIDDMIDRLAMHHFLAVTGLSGSGKSSLARTGLLDALDRGLLVEAGSFWRIASFRPGGEPLAHLTEAVLAATETPATPERSALTEAKLARGPLGLVQWLDEIEFPERTNLLVLVDQFEEIFRYRQQQANDEIDAFVALLLASAKQTKRPIYVVITMRSDFLGDCARFTNLAETINDGQFLIPRLTRDQCRQAIEEPARVYGGRVEEALITRLLNDMGSNQDQLPLLQHALMLLWQRARQRAGDDPPLLTLADYESLGGIGTIDSGADTSAGTDSRAFNGALSDHADQVLAGLTDEQQRLAAILFRALTESEGGAGRDVRRPVSLAKAAAIADVPSDNLMPVIEAFRAPGRNFLTPPAPEHLSPQTIIDISHESLIRQWVKLRRWVREEFQSAETYRGIERSAKRWKNRLGNLLSKLDLAVARKWRKAERPNAAWAERYGDAFPLAMEFLRKSERYRFWRRGLASAAIITPLVLIAGVIWLMFYEITVVLVTIVYLIAGEFANYEIKPQAVLKQDHIGSETPMTIPGGQVAGTLELRAALETGKLRGAPFILIDAWADTEHETIPKAVRITYAGNSGNFHDNYEDELAEKLKALTGDNRDMSLVFYCTGSKCWESYNACLRAIFLGYSHVYWYRGGVNAWRDADETLSKQTAAALAGNEVSRAPIKPSTVLSNIPDIILLISNRMIRSPAADQEARGEVKDSDYYYQRGRAEADKDAYDDAIADFIKAISLSQENANFYYDRGRAYANKADYDDALADFDKAAALDPAKSADVETVLRDPKYAAAYASRGSAFRRKGDYDHAFADYSQAIMLNPKNAGTYNIRCWARVIVRQFQEAISDCNESLSLRPNDADTLDSRGFAYLQLGRFDDSIADFDAALKANPKLASSLYGRGLAKAKKGDHAGADADIAAAKAIQSNVADVLARDGVQ
jgi:PQQ-dependent catabolism-associated CXXCW motif protein